MWVSKRHHANDHARLTKLCPEALVLWETIIYSVLLQVQIQKKETKVLPTLKHQQ